MTTPSQKQEIGERVEKWIETQHGSAGWEQKLVNLVEYLISQHLTTIATEIEKEKQTSENGYFYDEDNVEHEEFEEAMQTQFETMGEAYHSGVDIGSDKALSIINRHIKSFVKDINVLNKELEGK